MTAFTKFMKNYKQLCLEEVANLAKEALLSLQFHKNLKFVGIVLDIFSEKLSMKNGKNATKTVAKGNNYFRICKHVTQDVFVADVMLALLSHSDPIVQMEAYNICHRKIGETISPKLNVLKSGSPGTQILFLLQPEIIVELASFGLAHSDPQVFPKKFTLLQT